MWTTGMNARELDDMDTVDAVVAIGAVEQHGAHLPVGSDCIIAEYLAGRIAEALNAYLLPTFPISSSIEHRLSRGTVYLQATTLASVIRDLAESLRFSGFRRLVIVNGHGGNWIIKPTIRQINRDFPDFRAVPVHADIGIPHAAGVLEHLHGDIHAGEFETSVMMHIHPELVGAIEPAVDASFPPQSFMDYFDSTELATRGYWGYPHKATAEKGKRLLDITLERALAYLQAIEDHANVLKEET